MRPRLLLSTLLALVLCLGLLTPAMATTAPSTAAATPAQNATSDGELIPLDPLGQITTSDGPRTGADIVGGSKVPRRSHRFVALIVFFDGDGEATSSCTGTLIRRRWVLTAAHCLAGSRGAIVVLGATRLDDIKPRNVFHADAAAIAPNYRPNVGRNDIAVLRLERTAKATPIRLATARNDKRVKAGTRARILGWGATDGSGTATDHLRRGTVKVASNAACRNDFGSLWRGRRMLCAGSVASDACFGDSGGPLLIRGRKGWIQHGVTSFGDSACNVGDASVYTRVAALRPWIERVTGLRHRR